MEVLILGDRLLQWAKVEINVNKKMPCIIRVQPIKNSER